MGSLDDLLTQIHRGATEIKSHELTRIAQEEGITYEQAAQKIQEARGRPSISRAEFARRARMTEIYLRQQRRGAITTRVDTTTPVDITTHVDTTTRVDPLTQLKDELGTATTNLETISSKLEGYAFAWHQIAEHPEAYKQYEIDKARQQYKVYYEKYYTPAFRRYTSARTVYGGVVTAASKIRRYPSWMGTTPTKVEPIPTIPVTPKEDMTIPYYGKVPGVDYQRYQNVLRFVESYDVRKVESVREQYLRRLQKFEATAFNVLGASWQEILEKLRGEPPATLDVAGKELIKEEFEAWKKEFIAYYKHSPEELKRALANLKPWSDSLAKLAQTYVSAAGIMMTRAGETPEQTLSRVKDTLNWFKGIVNQQKSQVPKVEPEMIPVEVKQRAEARLSELIALIKQIEGHLKPVEAAYYQQYGTPTFAESVYRAGTEIEYLAGPALGPGLAAVTHIGSRIIGSVDETLNMIAGLLGQPTRKGPAPPTFLSGLGIFGAPSRAELETHWARRLSTSVAGAAIMFPLEMKAITAVLKPAVNMIVRAARAPFEAAKLEYVAYRMGWANKLTPRAQVMAFLYEPKTRVKALELLRKTPVAKKAFFWKPEVELAQAERAAQKYAMNRFGEQIGFMPTKKVPLIKWLRQQELLKTMPPTKKFPKLKYFLKPDRLEYTYERGPRIIQQTLDQVRLKQILGFKPTRVGESLRAIGRPVTTETLTVMPREVAFRHAPEVWNILIGKKAVMLPFTKGRYVPYLPKTQRTLAQVLGIKQVGQPYDVMFRAEQAVYRARLATQKIFEPILPTRASIRELYSAVFKGVPKAIHPKPFPLRVALKVPVSKPVSLPARVAIRHPIRALQQEAKILRFHWGAPARAVRGVHPIQTLKQNVELLRYKLGVPLRTVRGVKPSITDPFGRPIKVLKAVRAKPMKPIFTRVRPLPSIEVSQVFKTIPARYAQKYKEFQRSLQVLKMVTKPTKKTFDLVAQYEARDRSLRIILGRLYRTPLVAAHKTKKLYAQAKLDLDFMRGLATKSNPTLVKILRAKPEYLKSLGISITEFPVTVRVIPEVSTYATNLVASVVGVGVKTTAVVTPRVKVREALRAATGVRTAARPIHKVAHIVSPIVTPSVTPLIAQAVSPAQAIIQPQVQMPVQEVITVIDSIVAPVSPLPFRPMMAFPVPVGISLEKWKRKTRAQQKRIWDEIGRRRYFPVGMIPLYGKPEAAVSELQRIVGAPVSNKKARAARPTPAISELRRIMGGR